MRHMIIALNCWLGGVLQVENAFQPFMQHGQLTQKQEFAGIKNANEPNKHITRLQKLHDK